MLLLVIKGLGLCRQNKLSQDWTAIAAQSETTLNPDELGTHVLYVKFRSGQETGVKFAAALLSGPKRFSTGSYFTLFNLVTPAVVAAAVGCSDVESAC